MKEKFKSILAWSIILVTLIVTSCGESSDPTNGDVKLTMKATTTTSTINAGARIAETGVEFTVAMIGVTEIELETMGEHSDDSGDDDSSDDDSSDGDSSGDDDSDDDSHHDDGFEIEYEGQFVVDLLAGTSDPDFGIADLLPGTYKEIEVKLRPIMDDGNSLFISFTYQPTEGDPVTVEVSSKRELEFEVENHAGIQVEGNNLSQILILFNLDEVLSGIDFTQATADEDGVIRINDSSNIAFVGSLLSNFENSCKSGEDEDGDDKFDDDHSDDD